MRVIYTNIQTGEIITYDSWNKAVKETGQKFSLFSQDYKYAETENGSHMLCQEGIRLQLLKS